MGGERRSRGGSALHEYLLGLRCNKSEPKVVRELAGGVHELDGEDESVVLEDSVS